MNTTYLVANFPAYFEDVVKIQSVVHIIILIFDFNDNDSMILFKEIINYQKENNIFKNLYPKNIQNNLTNNDILNIKINKN